MSLTALFCSFISVFIWVLFILSKYVIAPYSLIDLKRPLYISNLALFLQKLFCDCQRRKYGWAQMRRSGLRLTPFSQRRPPTHRHNTIRLILSGQKTRMVCLNWTKFILSNDFQTGNSTLGIFDAINAILEQKSALY